MWAHSGGAQCEGGRCWHLHAKALLDVVGARLLEAARHDDLELAPGTQLARQVVHGALELRVGEDDRLLEQITPTVFKKPPL